MCIDFRDKGKEGKRERNISRLPPTLTLTPGDQTHNLGMCPDWESITQHFGLQVDATTNWATSARAMHHFFLIPSSISGHSGCFHALGIVSTTAMNREVQMSSN